MTKVPPCRLRFGGGKLKFFGFEGPVRDMDTQNVVLTVHLAKVHVLYRKSIVFVHSNGHSVRFRVGFGTNGGAASQRYLRVCCVLVGEN